MTTEMNERREKGLYWDRAWKLVEGCTHVSPGCDNCWSEAETLMRAGHPNEAISTRAHEVLHCDPADHRSGFSGRILPRHNNLDLPLRTKRPTVFAVWNDLFHESVPSEFIIAAYEVMLKAEMQGLGHTFLILTKRAERMARVLDGAVACLFGPKDFVTLSGVASSNAIWHGVTAENQQRADERIPHLLQIPGNRFLSVEPMLSAVDLSAFFGGPYASICEAGFEQNYNFGIHAVMLGGESGHSARPMNPQWARDVRDQCAAADVPYFHKQNGEWASVSEVAGVGFHHYFPTGETVRRVGKRAAGRLLDGSLHDFLPWDGRGLR